MEKNGIILAICVATLVSSCSSYTGAGAATGGYFGSMIGSAIGGITGGPRGRDVGTLIGTAGGAMVGAAVGAAADQAEQKKYEEYMQDRQQRRERLNNNRYGSYNGYDNYQYGGYDNSGFDPNNGGDDRIEFDNYITVELRKATFNDADRDGRIRAGEECKLSFEIMNHSGKTLYDVIPTVAETTGNKHIHISPTQRIESIAPHSGVRYTATVYGDSRLKNGEAIINVSVSQGNRQLTTDVKEFRIATIRK